MNEGSVKTEMDNKDKKQNKLWLFIKENIGYVILFILLLVSIIWALLKININDNRYKKQITELKTIQINQIDSIKSASYEQMAEVFSWAVRSELIRQNYDQISQFFKSMVQDSKSRSNIHKLYLVDPSNHQVIISTDQKDEGTTLSDIQIQTNEMITRKENNYVRIISPIMGLNKQLGILVIDFNEN